MQYLRLQALVLGGPNLNPGTPLLSVRLWKVFNLSMFQFPHLIIRDNNSGYLKGLSRRLNDVMIVKHCHALTVFVNYSEVAP